MNNVGTYLRDGPFKSDIGFVNLHPFQSIHCVLYIMEIFFDSYGCAPSQKLSKFIIKRNGQCLISEYKIRGLTKKYFGAGFCLNKIYLRKVIGLDFIPVLSNLYCQTISWLETTLRKMTFDNSVKYIPQSEQTHSNSRERGRERERKR